MVDSVRLREELREMRSLIRDDPKVRAQFDKDGNGSIDGQEWEEVRQLVIRRLEREEQEAAESARLQRQAQQEGGESVPTETGSPAAGAVAREIFDDDLAPKDGYSGVGASIAELRDVVLQQEGGVKQLFGATFRREYTIRSLDGRTVGMIQQRENEMLQEMTNRNWLEVPNLHFDVLDQLTGESYVFKRSEGLAKDRIGVFDGRGMMVAYTAWKFHLVWKKYEVGSYLDGSKLFVQNQLTRPFTLAVLDIMEQPVGRIVRGFSGLGGFLSGGNRLRIQLQQGEANPQLVLGVLAAALLVDLDREEGQDNGPLSFLKT